MTFSTSKQTEQPYFQIAGALTTAVIFVFVLCFLFEPRWETNDDVGMSMVAHGYGAAAVESPNIFFSNVLWGYVVQAIPEINGIPGYSIATMGTLIVIGTVLLYGLYRMGAGYPVCFSVFVLIMVRPVLFPQFTINAGLLMVCGVICWLLYDRDNDWRALAIGCVLAFFSFLIRRNEFLLVLIVALPFLPWRNLFQRRSFKLATSILLLAIIISTVINHQAYQGNQWKAFNEFNLTRALFTDFQADVHLKQRPDLLEQHGYSINDINLITNWFFADPALNNPQNLQAMVADLGTLPWLKKGLNNFLKSLEILGYKETGILLMIVLLLIVLRTRQRGVAGLCLFLAIIFLMSLLGRPGISRVHTPLLSLLIVVPFLIPQVSVRHHKLVTGALLVAAIVNCFYVFSDANKWQEESSHIQKFSTSLPNETIVLWGGAFPLETVYSVLRTPASARSHRFYALGVFTLAPFSVSFEEEKNGTGLIERLKKESGVPIFANPRHIRFLENYCIEHLNGNLKEVSAEQYGIYKLSWQSCKPQKSLK